jgi:hypothetical protein
MLLAQRLTFRRWLRDLCRRVLLWKKNLLGRRELSLYREARLVVIAPQTW